MWKEFRPTLISIANYISDRTNLQWNLGLKVMDTLVLMLHNSRSEVQSRAANRGVTGAFCPGLHLAGGHKKINIFK